MMFSTLELIGLGGIGMLALTVFAVGYLYHRERRRAAEAIEQATGAEVAIVSERLDAETAASGDSLPTEPIEIPDDPDLATDGGATADVQAIADQTRLEPPDVGGSLGSLLGHWRHQMKEKRMARKGYVKWYKVGPNLRRPEWIKPFRNGQGQLVYYDDDGPYLFPEGAMATDARTGARVCIHREGDALPVDLNDPEVEGLAVDKLQETIDLSVESDAPGFFDKHEIDGQTLFYGGIALMLVIAALGQFMGGGF